MTYRNDIDALSARHSVLAAELDAKTRELDSTSRMLDEMKAKARLPVLPNIRVASPCSADWNAMTPVDADTERVRHCGSCDKSVYNLSQMTRDEAEALILAKEGRLCVRYFQRKDGTILLKDCTVGTSQKRKRRLFAAGAAAVLAAGGGAAAYVMHTDSDGKTHRYEPIAGGAMPMPTQMPDEVHEMKGDIGPAPEHLEVMQGGMPAPHDLDDPFAQKKAHAKHKVSKKRAK